MVDIVQKRFTNDAVVSLDNVNWMYTLKKAKEVVQFCREKSINIEGIEGLRLVGTALEPSQEHTKWFPKSKNCWNDAMAFLESMKDDDWTYEIFYDGY